MEVYSLPTFFGLEQEAPIQCYNYQTKKPQLRNKISLTQNAFSFLLDGTKEVITEQKPTAINNTQFLLMNAGNCLMTEQLSSSRLVYKSILLFFSDDLLLQFLEKYNIHNSNTTNSTPIPVKVGEYDGFIKAFVNNLEGIQQLSPALQQKLLKVKFEEIMLYLWETKGSDFFLFLLDSISSQTRNFLRVVENNQLNKLSLKELSFLSNMSISSFKREFEQHFHTSPSKWFQDKRLEHAAFLLKHKAQRPSDVYDQAGYENLSNFIQAFKLKFGVTPKQYQSAN